MRERVDLDRWAERAAMALGALIGCVLIAVFAAGFAVGAAW